MKGTMVTLLSTVIVLVALDFPQAQVPKEGAISALGAYSTTSLKILVMGKDRLQNAFELTGVVIDDSTDSIIHNASFRCVGAAQIVKGTLDESYSCVYVCPDGDQIFVTTKGSGTYPTGVKKTWAFVGGTGKFVAIEGSGESIPTSGIRPAAELSLQGYVKMTGKYKLP